MNERIKELAEKAGMHKFGIADDSNLDKFVDLLVKECAKFLDDNSGYDNANNAWHPEPEDLLKHFGVEK